MRDVDLPDAREVGGLVVASGGRAEGGEGRAIVLARDHSGEDDVVQADCRSDVVIVGPGDALVARHGDVRTPVAVRVAEVHRSVLADADRRIALALHAARDVPRCPGLTVVEREMPSNDSAPASQVSCAVTKCVKVAGMVAPRTVTISLPPALAREVDRVARTERRSRSELMREAFRQYVARAERWEQIFAAGTQAARRTRLTVEDVTRVIKERRRARAR